MTMHVRGIFDKFAAMLRAEKQSDAAERETEIAHQINTLRLARARQQKQRVGKLQKELNTIVLAELRHAIKGS